MPLYEFMCPQGHKIEVYCTSTTASDAPTSCPVQTIVVQNDDSLLVPCGEPLARVEVSAPASVFPGADSWQK